MTGVTVVLRVEVPQAAAPETSKSKKSERPQITKTAAPAANNSMVFKTATGWKLTGNNMLAVVEGEQDIATFHVGDCTAVYFTEAV